MRNEIIGLIGGNGSYASAYFYKLLLDKSRELYGAKNNDDFPHIIIDSIPVPDFISDTKNLEIAKKMLTKSARRLDRCGCSEIAVVCNTIHILTSELVHSSDGKFVSMIDLVAKKVEKLGFKRAGLLATPTTIKSEIYANALKDKGIQIVNESVEIQLAHEQIVRQVVAGKIEKSQTELLEKLVQEFIEREKLDGIILGCTELPLVFPKDKFVNVVDCLDELADGLLFKYYNREVAN